MSSDSNPLNSNAIDSPKQVYDEVSKAHNPELALALLRLDIHQYNATHSLPDQQTFWKNLQGMMEKDGLISRLSVVASREMKGLGQHELALDSVLQEKVPASYVFDRPGYALPIENFPAAASSVLNKINPNGVTKYELGLAIENPAFTRAEAQALPAMYANFDELHTLSADKGLLSVPSITSADLQKLQEFQLQHPDIGHISDMQGLFNWTSLGHLNKYGDSFSSNDIANILNKKDLPDEDRQWFDLIQFRFSQMANSQGIVSQDSISKYSTTVQDLAFNDKEGKVLYGVSLRLSLMPQDPNTSRELYGKGIDPSGVHQGQAGDCFFEAPLASVVLAHPELIRNAIQDNHNGTYTVTFPGAKDTPVTVQAPTGAELTMYNSGNETGLWASILEKAYGKYLADAEANDTWNMAKVDAQDSPNPPPNENWETLPYQNEISDGGSSYYLTKFLTGRDVNIIKPSAGTHLKEPILKELEAAFPKDGKPVRAVVAGTGGEPYGITGDGLENNHAYSVVAFNPNNNGDGEVTLRNPATGRDRTVSIDQLMTNVDLLYFEQ